MLFVQFTINDEYYIIDINSVTEIIPVVKFDKILKSPAFFSGVINYHGKIIPVVDLTYIYTKKLSNILLSSRIIIVKFNNYKNINITIGILAENVTETIELPESEFQDIDFKTQETEYMNKLTVSSGKIFRWIKSEKIIPLEVQKSIFKEEV